MYTMCTCKCTTYVYDRLDILPNNVPDSDVSMYNVHYVHSVNVQPGTYVYDRLDILPNNVPDLNLSMYSTFTLCTIHVHSLHPCTLCTIH